MKRFIKTLIFTLVHYLPDVALLLLARIVASLRPLKPYPGWFFNIDDANCSFLISLRKAIWETCYRRQLKKPILFPWYGNSRIHLYLGNDMSQPTYIGGCIEPNELVFMESVLKPHMVVCDIGANDGFFTIFAAKLVGPSGKVLAFEPSQQEFSRLQANLALNRLSQVTAIPKALADTNSTALLKLAEYSHEGQNTLGDFSYTMNASGVQTVELCRLDDFLLKQKMTRLDFLKIDVEGAEYRVLAGARETIKKFNPIIMLELFDKALRFQGSSAEQVIALLKEFNYTVLDFSPETGTLVVSQNTTHSENIVACPSTVTLP